MIQKRLSEENIPNNIINNIIDVNLPEIQCFFNNEFKKTTVSQCIIKAVRSKVNKSDKINFAFTQQTKDILFNDVEIESKLILSGKVNNVSFVDCEFSKDVVIEKLNSKGLVTFENCIFKGSSLSFESSKITNTKILNPVFIEHSNEVILNNSEFSTFEFNDERSKIQNIPQKHFQTMNCITEQLVLFFNANTSIDIIDSNSSKELKIDFISTQMLNTLLSGYINRGITNINFEKICPLKNLTIEYSRFNIISNSKSILSYLQFENSSLHKLISKNLINSTNKDKFSKFPTEIIRELINHKDNNLQPILREFNSMEVKNSAISSIQSNEKKAVIIKWVYNSTRLFYGYASDYGTNAKKVLLFSLYITVFFATLFDVIYFFTYIFEDFPASFRFIQNNIFESIEFFGYCFVQSGSFFTTLGMKNIQTMPLSIEFLGYIEAVLGVLMLSLFMNVFIKSIKY